MSFAMASLLIHSEHVPTAAREALRSANVLPPERRLQLLTTAARILHAEMGVACSDAFELVDLPAGDCCG
jgi:hypothetical protein